jgi:hypothetical protein
MEKTMVKKSIANKITTERVSSVRARQLKHAIRRLDRWPIDRLCRAGIVVKLKVTGQDNLYAYRLSGSSRMIFSLTEGKKMVLDIVDTDKLNQD